MKLGVVFFHKNIDSIYPKRWTYQCINSMLKQTCGDLNFYEIDYGATNNQLTNGTFYNHETVNHADAMNFIITKAFEDGCEYVFNTNLDDYYEYDRVEKQLVPLQHGYDIVSSDFRYVDENCQQILHVNILQYRDITYHLTTDHNTIAHPCVAFSKRFWMDHRNRYKPDELPREDLNMWRRSINNGYKFYICEDVLLNYRIHDNQITSMCR